MEEPENVDPPKVVPIHLPDEIVVPRGRTGTAIDRMFVRSKRPLSIMTVGLGILLFLWVSSFMTDVMEDRVTPPDLSTVMEAPDPTRTPDPVPSPELPVPSPVFPEVPVTPPPPPPPPPPPVVQTDPDFGNCKLANEAGYGDYKDGIDPEYQYPSYRDADNDGTVCELPD